MQLESLNVNANGKIDKNQLPQPQNKNDATKILLPRNDIETRLIEILKQLLNVNVVSIEDSFFEMGGDSLSAINLCVKIQNEFNVKLFVKDILETPIIKDISDMIQKNINTSKTQEIQKTENKEYYPISSAQKRIYYASKIAGEEALLYNISGAEVLEGNIDAQKLENCFKTLINRHEALRTYFVLNNGEVMQKVEKDVDFKLEIVENAEFDNLENISKKFVMAFNLEKAPLFRTKLVKFTNGKSAILIDTHHIILDGASIAILTDELCKLYNGENLKDISITYKDYAMYENEKLKNGEFNEAESYWVSQFETEIPVLDMPTNNSRPGVQNYEGKKLYSHIDKETAKKIEQISKKLKITPYMFLLSAYYILLSKYTSQDDIVIGSPASGRDILDTYDVIGMFVNTLALREKINSKLSFKEFMIQVKNNLLNAYKYQTYPFDELVNKLDIKRDTSRNPLFDTMFTYQNNGYSKLNFEGVRSEYYIPDTNISKFDISIEAIPSDEGIKLIYEYMIKLFKEEFIEELSINFLNLLNIILENIDEKICDICILANNQRDKILYEFNKTQLDYPKEKTIVDIFEKQVIKTPENVAVVYNDKKLTYRKLNERANKFANYLKENGAKKGDIIVVYMNRSIDMIVSMLAIIKLRRSVSSSIS